MKAMTASRLPALRWGICFALALCFHAAGAAVLLARCNESADLVANAPVVMVDLAPVAVSPETTPNALPPGPQQPQAQIEPKPEKTLEKLELPVQPNSEPLLAVSPPKSVEKSKEKQPKQKHASLASAPSSADQKADRVAAPMPGASSQNPNALPNWKSQLVAQIERHKRYPDQANGEHGVVQVAFGVDRSGGVHHARVVASSGSSILDRDAIAWLERAQPLPPPPPEMTGAMIHITVPLRYNYR
jgi:protein TonB